MSRARRWVMLLSIPVGLLVVFFLCVPYQRADLYIDRQTGHLVAKISTYGLFTEIRPIAMPKRGQPDGLAPLTAPSRDILVRTRAFRFPWSRDIDYERVHPENEYCDAFVALFLFDSGMTGTTKLSNEALEKILRERILIWNSPDLDRDLHGTIERITQENAKF